MNNEFTGKMDIHVTHDFSRRINERKNAKIRNSLTDLFTASKVEMNYSDSKGAA